MTRRFQRLLSPPDGLTAAAWERQVKEQFPEPVSGISQEVPAELRAQYDAVSQAVTFWEEQRRLVLTRIREALGKAETATIGGRPFLTRYLTPVRGHYVKPGHRDELRKPPKEGSK